MGRCWSGLLGGEGEGTIFSSGNNSRSRAGVVVHADLSIHPDDLLHGPVSRLDLGPPYTIHPASLRQGIAPHVFQRRRRRLCPWASTGIDRSGGGCGKREGAAAGAGPCAGVVQEDAVELARLRVSGSVVTGSRKQTERPASARAEMRRWTQRRKLPGAAPAGKGHGRTSWGVRGDILDTANEAAREWRLVGRNRRIAKPPKTEGREAHFKEGFSKGFFARGL